MYKCVCRECKEPFASHQKRQFCSIECRYKNQEQRRRSCEFCGKSLIPRRKNPCGKYVATRFCSRDCFEKSKRPEPITCPTCGKQVIRTKHKQVKTFCSIKCHQQWRHRRESETKQCPTCGNPFTSTKKQRKKYCSFACRNVGYIKYKDRAAAEDGAFHSRLKYLYGISIDKYKEILKAQGNVCPITGKRSNSQLGKKIRLSLDHNHITGKVRGIIDGAVNRGFGFVGVDDPRRALKVCLYLLKHCLTETGIQDLAAAVSKAMPAYIKAA